MKQWLEKNPWIWPLIGSIVLWVLIGALSGNVRVAVLVSSVSLASFSILLGFGQMMVVTSGNGAIDLSATYILTFAAYIACSFMEVNILLGFLVAMAVGALVGVVNALINIYLKVPVMITTLATGYIVYSMILIFAPMMKTLPNSSLVKFVIGYTFGISNLTYVCVVVMILLYILLYKSKYGKQLHAVGQNRLAAKYVGVSVTKIIIKTFALSGMIAAFTGALCGAYIGGAFQDMSNAYFLPSITAVLVGGTSAAGGKSNVVGAFFGAIMMSLLTTFLNVTRLEPGYQNLVQGVVLILVLIASVSKKAGHA